MTLEGNKSFQKLVLRTFGKERLLEARGIARKKQLLRAVVQHMGRFMGGDVVLVWRYDPKRDPLWEKGSK